MYIRLIFVIVISIILKSNYHFNNEGIENYNNHNYDQAIKYFLESYKKEKNYIDLFNIGNSYYRKNDYNKAINYYNFFLKKSNNDILKSKAYYNIGNSYYRLYQKENNLEYINKSIYYYQKSIEIDNNYKAKENILFIKNLLENQKNNSNKNSKKNSNNSKDDKNDTINSDEIENTINKLKEEERFYSKYFNNVNFKVKSDKDW